MTADEDYALEDRIAKRLREEFKQFFGDGLFPEYANCVARVSIQEMKSVLRAKASALGQD